MSEQQQPQPPQEVMSLTSTILQLVIVSSSSSSSSEAATTTSELVEEDDDEHDDEHDGDDSGGSYCREEEEEEEVLRIHPLLYEYLCISACEVDALGASDTKEIMEDTTYRCRLAPLPMTEFYVVDDADECTKEWERQTWNLTLLDDKGQDLPKGSKITLQCLYGAPPENIGVALLGRLIMKGTVMLLTVNSSVDSCILLVRDIETAGDEEDCVSRVVYRLGPLEAPSSIEVLRETTTPYLADGIIPTGNLSSVASVGEAEQFKDCPGYASLRDEIVLLLRLSMTAPTAAPSGILVTGCNGVGKTHLAQCVATFLPEPVHWVSVPDLVLQASWATEDDLLITLTPPTENQALVLDGLDSAGNGEEESSTSNDRERRIVRNSLVQAIDRLIQTHTPILATATSPSAIHADLTKANRLEKEIPMNPPSQEQREEILLSLLCEMLGCLKSEVSLQIQKWSQLLATMTAGFVASDLLNMCTDAWCKSQARVLLHGNDRMRSSSASVPLNAAMTWEELSEATTTAVPSQLAALDVLKPKNFLDMCSVDDWLQIHELSWKPFAGYNIIKKRIYRAVVVPWKRIFKNRILAIQQQSIAPPSGVLLYGPSGCGKTLAANCLGSSLGLPMIKVSASDVLDKWLGGSEAMMRSLFARSRAASPSILFFDEIDSIASNRANEDEGGSTGVTSRLLSTLLNEIDGVSSGSQIRRVIVIACTNRLETLDSALLRPGRLEEHVFLPKPELSDVKAILRHCLSLVPLHESVDLDAIAKEFFEKSPTGADIEGICREAVSKAIHRCTRMEETEVSVTTDDILDAITTVYIK